jgi:GWxTD domain-containing protein
MKTKSFFTLGGFPMICLLLIAICMPASATAKGKNLSAYLSYTSFYSPNDGPYLETNLSVVGSTVTYVKKSDGKFQGSIQVIMLFRKEQKIVHFNKYELRSPELEDTTNLDFQFIDQQRILLPNGSYDFEIQISDMAADAKPVIVNQPLELNYPEDKVTVSGIQLVESYKKAEQTGKLTKSGYDITPYVHTYYPGDMNRLIFYSEIYNTAKLLGADQKFLISYYLEDANLHKPVQEYIKHKKESCNEVIVLFSEFDIANLRSGNYSLAIEVRDQNNKLVGLNKLFFQRSNPKIQINPEDIAAISVEGMFTSRINDMDTLRDYIKCLEPISSEMEANFARSYLASASKDKLQKYLYNFWYERNEANPYEEWIKYLNEVNKVNLAYSTQIHKGYETDRGRVYLRYGPPNSISESYNEPGTYPYEIWHYYQLNSQRNRKFVFYTHDIVTNDFVLIHSDAIGELSNYRWQQVIYGRVDPGFNIDEGVKEDPWGGRSKEYFDLPR